MMKLVTCVVLACAAMTHASLSTEETYSSEVDNLAMDAESEAMFLEVEDFSEAARRRSSAKRAHRAVRKAARARRGGPKPKRAARKSGKKRGNSLKRVGKSLKRGGKKLGKNVKSKRNARKSKRAPKRNARKSKRASKRTARKTKKTAAKKAKQAKRASKRDARKAKKATSAKKAAAKKVKKSVAKANKKAAKTKKAAAKKAAKTKKVAAKKAKQAKKNAKKSFKPRKATPEAALKAKLGNALRVVVEDEPTSAAGKAEKADQWGFEKDAVQKLDRFTNKYDIKELKIKEIHLSGEVADICDEVEGVCNNTDTAKMSNTRTCVLTKDACFNMKIALEKTKRAQKQCAISNDYKQKSDFIGKLDYTVEVAKCRSYMKSVDFYAHKASKKHAVARMAKIIDAEANEARSKVAIAEPIVNALEKKVAAVKPAFTACTALIKKSKECADPLSVECTTLRTQSSQCEQRGDVENYDEVFEEYKEKKEKLKELVRERGIAEKNALKGASH